MIMTRIDDEDNSSLDICVGLQTYEASGFYKEGSGGREWR